jgi:hypothetical protein
MQDPDLTAWQRLRPRQLPTVVGEEQDRIGRVDNLKLSGQVPASQRDENGAHWPWERIASRGGSLPCSDPQRPALDSGRLTVRRDPPERDSVRRLTHGRQDHLDAFAERIQSETRARASVRSRNCAAARDRQIQAAGLSLVSGRIDYESRKPYPVQVRLGFAESFQ